MGGLPERYSCVKRRSPGPDRRAFHRDDFEQIHPDGTLGDLVRAISSSRRNIFPVVHPSGQLAGVIHLDDVREIIFQTGIREKVLISTIMRQPSTVISME